MDDLGRTGLHALTAIGAFFVVDRSMEIINMDSFIWTFLLADTAADTAVLAVELGGLAVVL